MPVQVTVVDHPVAQEALTNLRDQNTTNQIFRAEMRRLSLVVVAEATRRIPTTPRKVTTPLATTDGVQLASRPVLVPILRAGLGMLPAAMELLPDADIAVVGVKRDEETPRTERIRCEVAHQFEWPHLRGARPHAGHRWLARPRLQNFGGSRGEHDDFCGVRARSPRGNQVSRINRDEPAHHHRID